MELYDKFEAWSAECNNHPYPSLQDRKRQLSLLKKGLQNQSYTLVEALNKDFSYRSEMESLFCDVFPVIKSIDFCSSKLKHWMKNRKRHVGQMFPAHAYLAPQPLGIIGIMVPWNYPVSLSLIPAVYALAAGNKVMIKTSELSPHTSVALKELIDSADLADVLFVIPGDEAVSRQFAALAFGHLIFTGSTKVGKHIMKAASENLTPVTLELGGKSPVILSSTMNHKYFNRVFMGKMLNAGQTCVAPDYILAPQGWDAVIEKEFKQFIEKYYINLPNNVDYSSIISRSHQQRLLNLVEDARQKGARVLEFGTFISESSTHKMPAYLLFNVNMHMNIMKEEIFGPLLPVLTYDSFPEAVNFVKKLPHPLALYYIGEDRQERHVLQTETLSGALVINDTLIHVAMDDLPFGGVGASGMGHYHGQEGFDTFSKLKPVLVQKGFSSMAYLYPPYGALMRFVLTWIGGIKIKR